MNNSLVVAAAVCVIAIGAASFWIPAGSPWRLIVPAIGICAGVLIWLYSPSKNP
jgi:hypothetical protein